MSTGAVGGEGGASLHGGSVQGAHGASATGAAPSGNDPTSATTLNSMLQQFAGAVNAAAYGAEDEGAFDASGTASEQEFQPIDATGEDGGSGRGSSEDSSDDSGSSSTSTGGYNFSQVQEGTSAAMSELEAKTLQASYAGASAAQEVEVAGIANQRDSGISGYNADMNAAQDTMNQAKYDLSASMVQAGLQAGGAAMSFGMTVQGESAAAGSQKDLNSYSNTQKAIAAPPPPPERTMIPPGGGTITSGPNGTTVTTPDGVPVSTDKQQFTVNGEEPPAPGTNTVINSSTISTSQDGNSLNIQNGRNTTVLNQDGTVTINGQPVRLGVAQQSTGYNPATSPDPLSGNEVANPDPDNPDEYTTADRQQLVRTGKVDNDPTGAKTQSIVNDLKAGGFDDEIAAIDVKAAKGSTAAIEQSAAARNQYSAWASLCNAAFSSVATMASAPLTYEGAVQQKEAQIQSAESRLDSSSAQMSSSEISTGTQILSSVQGLVSSALSALSSTLIQNQ